MNLYRFVATRTDDKGNTKRKCGKVLAINHVHAKTRMVAELPDYDYVRIIR